MAALCTLYLANASLFWKCLSTVIYIFFCANSIHWIFAMAAEKVSNCLLMYTMKLVQHRYMPNAHACVDILYTSHSRIRTVRHSHIIYLAYRIRLSIAVCSSCTICIPKSPSSDRRDESTVVASHSLKRHNQNDVETMFELNSPKPTGTVWNESVNCDEWNSRLFHFDQCNDGGRNWQYGRLY